MTEKMKPSGIAWIGDVPQSWNISRLKYNITCLDEQRIPVDAALRNPGPYPYWGAGSIVDYVDNYIFDEELVLLGEDGAPFFDEYRPVAFLITEKIWANNHIHVIKGKQGVCNRFLVHYLNSVEYREYINGSILNKLTQGNMNEIVCPIPSAVEQEIIADFLDAQCAKIDSVIADIEKQIETLQKYKKSLITEAVTKGLDRSVPMKDSGIVWIGNVPEHWNLKRLKFMLENSSDSMKVGPFGSALSGGDFTDEGKWVYNQRVVLDKNFSENATFISEEKYREMQGFSVYPGDILITTRGTIGKVAIVPEGAQEGILHPCIIKFRVDKEMMMPELLELIFNESDFVKDQFTLMSNATTIEVIYSYSLKDIILPVIPAEEQKKIYSYLSEKCTTIDAVIMEKQKALSAITQHKKSLIYEYVTGKKRVTEVN